MKKEVKKLIEEAGYAVRRIKGLHSDLQYAANAPVAGGDTRDLEEAIERANRALDAATAVQLFIVSNHTLTVPQRECARKIFGVECSGFLQLPEDLSALWGAIPPELPSLAEHVVPVIDWVVDTAVPCRDIVCIQGDVGACALLASACREHNLLPVYATTERRAEEVEKPDGTVKKKSVFQHVRFRPYEVYRACG